MSEQLLGERERASDLKCKEYKKSISSRENEY
jgi:hypothetical protein